MNPKLLLLSLISLSFLATFAEAQTVELRGKVEDGEGACYDCPGFDFVLDGIHCPITCSTVDLDLFMSQQIHAVGEWNGSFAAPVVDLVSVALAAESFSFGGGGTVGQDLDFTAHANPGTWR